MQNDLRQDLPKRPGLASISYRDVPMRHRLRLYTGEEDADTGVLTSEPPLAIRLGDFTRVLNDAVRWKRSWVEDFENEEIQLPPDLFDVLSAYLHMRPGA